MSLGIISYNTYHGVNRTARVVSTSNGLPGAASWGDLGPVDLDQILSTIAVFSDAQTNQNLGTGKLSVMSSNKQLQQGSTDVMKTSNDDDNDITVIPHYFNVSA